MQEFTITLCKREKILSRVFEKLGTKTTPFFITTRTHDGGFSGRNARSKLFTQV